MAYKASLIIGPDGSTQSHVHSLMGCFALASTEERAAMKLKSAISEYFRWLQSHGEHVVIPMRPKLAIEQELRVRGSPGDAGGPDPLLRCDRVAASYGDIIRCLRLLDYTREDLLRLVSGISRKALGWRPEHEPRSVRDALRHIAQVDIWYLSRINADPRLDKTKMKDVFTFLKYSRSLVRDALPSLTKTQLVKVFYPHKWSDKPYPWTATKVLHRLVTHERQHTSYLRRILTLPGTRRRLESDARIEWSSVKEILDTNPYALPGDLPVPVDDGACVHLTAMRLPPVTLRSTKGRDVNLAEASHPAAVFFFYPHTGRPRVPIPEGWNEVPGARGCTPQSCGFRDHYREFKRLGFEVFGVSAQVFEEQLEFAKRNNLPYELLNDSKLELTRALRLPTFQFQSKVFIKRLAFVTKRGIIEKVFYPVFPPDRSAEVVLGYLGAK